MKDTLKLGYRLLILLAGVIPALAVERFDGWLVVSDYKDDGFKRSLEEFVDACYTKSEIRKIESKDGHIPSGWRPVEVLVEGLPRKQVVWIVDLFKREGGDRFDLLQHTDDRCVVRFRGEQATVEDGKPVAREAVTQESGPKEYEVRSRVDPFTGDRVSNVTEKGKDPMVALYEAEAARYNAIRERRENQVDRVTLTERDTILFYDKESVVREIQTLDRKVVREFTRPHVVTQ